jgi:protein-L-isoaspartate(D-aspartate) O-methyltransferase
MRRCDVGRPWHEAGPLAYRAERVNPKPAARGARFPVVLERTAPDGATRNKSTLRPQAPLHQAARDAVQQHRPSGLGLDSAAVRSALVQRLRAELHCHDAVCQAMLAVPRHHFVDSALVTQAYADTSLPIGLGQTISKPSVVARMLSLLHEGGRARAGGTLGRVLEIGTGCGYQTALLGRMAQRVLSIERLKPLHDKARANLGEWRAGHIRLVYGDGRLGHPPHAPYDSIIAAAGGSELPAAWLEQLADGGRLVAPMEGRAGSGQVLLVVDRQGDDLRRSMHEAVHFVPLRSGVG